MMKSMTLDLKDAKTYVHEIAESTAKNWRLILLALLFCCGLIAGTTLCIRSGDGVGSLIKQLLDKLFSQSVSRNFLILAGENTIAAAIVFVSGLCAVGLPAVLICPCIQGVIIGSISAYMYTVYNVDGVIFTTAIIIPFSVVTVLMLLIACNEAAIMSAGIVKAVLSVGSGKRGEVKSYFLRGIIIFIVICIASFLQAACITGFGEKLLL